MENIRKEGEISNNIEEEDKKNEIKEDVKNEIKEDIKNEVKEDIKNEIKEDVKNEVKDDIKNEVKEDIKNEIKETETINKYDKLQIESCKNIINYNSMKQKFDEENDNKSNSNTDMVLINLENKKDDDYNSANNLTNLSTLFNDYINKYDINKSLDKNRQRSIYKVRGTFRSNTIKENNEINNENEPINLYNIIKDRLNEVKQDTLYYLDTTKQKLEKKYNDYIKKIIELLFEKEKQISKLLGGHNKNDNFINYANNNLFKQIDDILEIHENIFSALEDHFNLLYSFLEQSSLIQQKKPIEYFINNNSSDILNCWFLNKIDFNQINISSIISNKELSDLCAGYLAKLNNNIYPSLVIQKNNNGNLSLEIDILFKNVNRLKKIKFIGLDKDDIYDILNDVKNKKFNNSNSNKNEENSTNAKKLKNLSIINSNLIIDKLPKITFPALKKFRLKRSYITFSYLFDNIFGETNSLIQIFIENIKMTDNSLKTFFDYIRSKKSILETLKNLSFKGNNLTKINLENFNFKNGQLKNLQYLNFSKNNIYEFSPNNIKIMPDLKVLDLTDNNISNSLLFESILAGKKLFKFIAMLSNNIFIHNNHKNNYKYIKYITEKLTIFEHKIKKVSFCLLFHKDNIEHLTKLKISPAVKISICKLDLSFCGLNDENLWKFFRNNFGLLNLEELNLSNNYFTDNFFNLCSGIQGNILLEKLYMIDLSANQINCRNINDLKALDTFVDNHQELKKIKVQETNFYNGLNKLIEGKIHKLEINNIINRLLGKNIKFVLNTELSNFADNNKHLSNLFLYKDKNY